MSDTNSYLGGGQDSPQEPTPIVYIPCTCEVITGGARVRRRRCAMHPDPWADEMADQMEAPDA